MADKDSLRRKRLQTLARSVSGRELIIWLEEIVLVYADVRNVKGNVSFEVRRDAVNIIENEIIQPLKFAARDQVSHISGDQME